MLKATRNHSLKQRRRQEKLEEKKKRQALLNLIEGAILYGICISLPAIFGVFVRFYESQYYTSNFLNVGFFSQVSLFDGISGLFTNLSSQFFSSSRHRNDSTKNFDRNITHNVPHDYLSNIHFSDKINDLQLICILSAFLAAVRLTMIYAIAPSQENKKDFIIRSRSTHMLRSYDLPTSPEKQRTKSGIRSLTPSPLRNSRKQQKQQDDNLISALRYATALFRLFYTLITSISAFYLFRNADFWPIYLGGKASSSTLNCWDLSGGIAFAGVDQDFDHFNSTLRYYFVVQASYQIQSLFFHCFLFLFSSWKLKKSWQVFLRTLTEHIIALALLSGSFVFSSWRRLTAVAMFALDCSGLLLHVLQLCLNFAASNKNGGDENNFLEEEFIRSKPVLVGNDASLMKKKARMKKRQLKRNLVWFVHRFLVLPSFMYCRFFVLPFIVWYSAAFESQEWLTHMEHAFVPGWGNFVYYFFNGLVMIIIILNLVLFRRLLFHPHVAQVLTENK